jgi:glutathione S-transferase
VWHDNCIPLPLVRKKRDVQSDTLPHYREFIPKTGNARTCMVKRTPMPRTTLTLSSRNYSSWSLRGWLLTKMSGIDFDAVMVPPGDPSVRAEILLLSPSILVPCLTHDGVKIWDTLAIAEYLNELKPGAGLLPSDRADRALCRAICGEMHSGFSAMRSALPMNLKAHFPGFMIWSRAQADIDRITQIWRDCLTNHGGPYLFGPPTMADAMYAPVATRFMTYDVTLDPVSAAYCQRIMEHPDMMEWVTAAKLEPSDIDELEVEF